MIGITEVFQLIVEGTNIFTLNKEEDIRIKIDRLADTISKAVILGYERSCIDAERHIEGGIDPASRVKGFKRDMDLILETVKGRADNE